MFHIPYSHCLFVLRLVLQQGNRFKQYRDHSEFSHRSFVMDVDEYIFSALEASNEKWTAGAGSTRDKMEDEIARQRAEIASQREEIDNQREEIDNQRKDRRLLREAVEKIQVSQAAAVTSDFERTECDRSTNVQHMEQDDQVSISITCEGEAEEIMQELKAAATTSSTTILQ